jgi:hypothetical protein
LPNTHASDDTVKNAYTPSPNWKIMFFSLAIAAAAAVGVTAGPLSRTCNPHPPGVIDLGYAKHIPTYVNETTSGHKVSIYKNIRFGNPPTKELRWRRADTDLPVVEEIQDGNIQSPSCISSAPSQVPFPGLNGTTWGQEDCLFLDVYVPEGVKPGDDVPVFHWFHGSAYAFGSKDIWTSPMGLFEQMHELHAGKFIFVANNYRCISFRKNF